MTDWAVPDPPYERADDAVGDMRVEEVAGALLTPVRRGLLRALERPDRWMRGAVHDAEGRLVVASQKIGGLGGNQLVAADPPNVPVRPKARRLPGTWLYGGHWIAHFGHFFTETLTTLWPDLVGGVEGLQGVVFHSYVTRSRGVTPWQRELIGLTSCADLPVEVVDADPVNVDRLIVPTRSVVVNGWVEPEAVAVWRRMAAAAGGATSLVPDGPRVFWSRTAFNAAKREAGDVVRTSVERDRTLDDVFAAAGFRIVAPETLPLLEQVRLASSASVLAGSAGTALHLSAFAPEGVRVLELGDDRSPDVQVPHQLAIDAACGHPSAFVPYDVAARDVAQVLAGLGL